ncbi:MAG: hypothetical protein JWN03_3722 [Nocardia sp.]|uniref:hypothetical protein n=1 Tax=Nocardia sp. TaxID=1821 RepID=UPI00263161A8|nr:hypothetical protein [Nocardia sp.]MCU1643447.1 hypothetical protein [Nocardia sp.]
MGTESVNPWLGTAQAAQDGTLTLDKGAATKAAGYAADLSHSLAMTKQWVFVVKEHKGFSDNGYLPKAVELAGRFNTEGGRLATIVDHYITLVDALGDTLVTAGKLYDATEESSADAFNSFKKTADGNYPVLNLTPDGKAAIPTWSEPTADAAFDKNSGYGGLKGIGKTDLAHYTDAIGAEDPSGHGGEWFYEVGVGINPQTVADRSDDWKNMAGWISKDFDRLDTLMAGFEKDKSWTGAGASGAIAAVKLFKSQADDLVNEMGLMSTNLDYTAGFLRNTKAALPEGWDGDKLNGTPTEDAVVKVAVAGFKTWYIPGIGHASTAIPKLSDPTAPAPVLQPPPTYHPRTYAGPGGPGPTGPAPSANGLNPSSLPGGQMQSVPNLKDAALKTDPSKSDPGKTDPSKTDPGKSGPGTTDPGQSSSGQSSNPAQTSQDSSSQSSQLQSALQQAAQSLQSAQTTTAQQQQQQTQDQLKNMTLAGMPNLLSQLSKDLPGGGGPGGGPGGLGVAPLKELNSRLFPRAAVAIETAESAIRAGVATGTATASPMGGMGGGMGGMGHGAGGQGGQGKEHKRAEFLDSTEALETAMGEAPIVAKPVVEG